SATINSFNILIGTLISSDLSNPSSGTRPDSKVSGVEQIKTAKNNVISSNAKQTEVIRTNISTTNSNALRINASAVNPAIIQGNMSVYGPLNPIPPHIAGALPANTSGQIISPPLHPPGYASHPWESIQPPRIIPNQQTGQITSFYNPIVSQEPMIYPYGANNIQLQYVGNTFGLPPGQWSQPYTYGSHPPYQWTHPHDARNSSMIVDSQWNAAQTSWSK
ncbi:24476_t:CDS:1, partial [Racocetra persica]